MNNQPSAEELLKEALTIFSKAKLKDSTTLQQLEAYEINKGLAQISSRLEQLLASREVSAAVTPLSWEEACAKVAETYRFSSWEKLIMFAIRKESILAYEKEAAQLFMSSNRDVALANFIENHATQIIPDK